MTNKLCFRTQSGFTALELVGMLVVLSFIILAANRVMMLLNQTRDYNQLADQGKQFSNLAIRYIEDNYRNLVSTTDAGNDEIIPVSLMTKYIPSTELLMNKRYQTPCVYVTGGNNHSIRAYLIFGNTSSKSKSLEPIEISKVAITIGNNAGILTNNNGAYVFSGGTSTLTLSSGLMTNIASSCGFTTPLPNNLLILDLSKNLNLFSSIKGNIDSQSSKNYKTPSLKKLDTTSVTTMQTNLYLDNIFQESSSRTNYYCDSNELPINDANNLCQNLANSNGSSLYPNSASWGSSILSSGSTCLATATAHFYTISSSYTCNGVNMGNPTNFCAPTSGGANIVLGSGYWNPSPGKLEGNQCSSIAYASYRYPSSCSIACNPVYGGCMADIINSYLPSGCRVGANYPTPIQASYNSQTGTCDLNVWATGNCGHNFYDKGVSVIVQIPSNRATDGGGQVKEAIACGQHSVNAFPSQSTIDLGFKDCGRSLYPALTSITGVPEQHIYRALDYGQSQVSGSRIQIKSAAKAGFASESSILLVNHAGLQAGLIAPLSHMVVTGDACSVTQLGKTAQEMINIGINSQIQCVYNPTFCAGDGYCYLPIKNTTFDYKFGVASPGYLCPPGTVVDVNQPPANILSQVSCPVISGWDLTQSVHGEVANCYITVTGMSFCQGYQTVCSYDKGKQVVAGLVKLRCTNDTAAYTVDNYTG